MPSVDEFSAFCAELTLDNGRPMLLEDFQREILADYFAGARETLILLPKKNGKTALLAALALYHLLTVDDAECVVGAASKDQATSSTGTAYGHRRATSGFECFESRTGSPSSRDAPKMHLGSPRGQEGR